MTWGSDGSGGAPPGLTDEAWLRLAGIGRWWYHLPTDTDWHDEQYQRMVGWRGRGVMPHPTQRWRDGIHPDDRAVVEAALQQLLDSDGGIPYEAVYRFRTPRGWRWLLSRGEVVARHPDGSPEWIAGVCMDVHKTMQATEGLERDERWLEAFDRLTQGFRFITVYGQDGRDAKVEFVSPTIEHFYGLSVDELRRDIEVLRSRMPAEDRAELQRTLTRAIAARASSWQTQYRIQSVGPGAKVWHIRILATGEYLPDGRSRWYGIGLDVTQQAQLQQRLQHKVEQLQSTLSLLPDLWIELDHEGRYVSIHANNPRLLLRPPGDQIGRHVREVLPSPVSERMQDAMFVAASTGAPQKILYQLDLADGRHHFEARIAVQAHQDKPSGYTILVRDQTETVRAYEAREQALLHDALTGLWNRAGFMDGALTRWRQLHAQCEHSTSLMMLIDIDGLREVNHTLGHDAGDTLLRTLADRIRQLHPSVLAARLGGDELLALVELPDLRHDEQFGAWVQQAWSTLAAAVPLTQLDYRPSLSIGWTRLSCAHDAVVADLREAVAQVEEGLYAAKRGGRGRIERFDEERFAHARRRHELAQALSAALAHRELWLAMQPIVHAHAPDVVAAEALLRWRSPKFGEVSPAQFIPLAERSRAIVTLGQWVLQQACHWAAARPAVAHVSVNISPMQFAQADFVDGVQQALAVSQLEPHRLCLEITESLLADDLAQVADKMQRLAALGVRFALDDFGTGYSNLLQLRTLPLHTLKLDRSYTRDILTDPDDALIVASVIQLAHQLQLTVVAEGVETREQAAWLLQRGCDALQGYLYGKPTPADDWPAQPLDHQPLDPNRP